MKKSHPLIFKDWSEFDHKSHYRFIEIMSDYFTHEKVNDDGISFFSVPYQMKQGNLIIDWEREELINRY